MLLVKGQTKGAEYEKKPIAHPFGTHSCRDHGTDDLFAERQREKHPGTGLPEHGNRKRKCGSRIGDGIASL